MDRYGPLERYGDLRTVRSRELRSRKYYVMKKKRPDGREISKTPCTASVIRNAVCRGSLFILHLKEKSRGSVVLAEHHVPSVDLD